MVKNRWELRVIKFTAATRKERSLQAAESRLLAGNQGCCVHLYGIYGQGMTSASLAAMMLDRCLKQVQSKPLNGFLLRFHKQLANILHMPWLMATGEDSRWSTTEGAKPR